MATKKIKEYSIIEAGIAKLAEQYATVPDCSNDKGLKVCKTSYRAIRKFEINLDAKRKELGDEARQHLKAIGDEAKSIDARLKAISTPFKLAFEQREQEIKEAEAQRIATIKARIEQLNEFIADAQSADSQGVTAITEAIDLIDCAVGFDEFTAEALQTKQGVLSQLGALLQNKLALEGAERERLAAEKLQQQVAAQQQIETRINNLRMIPVSYMGKSAAEISSKLEGLIDYAVPAEEFGDRYQEAITAKEQVTQQLSAMFDNQKMVEETQIKQQEQQEQQEQQRQLDKRAELRRQQEESRILSEQKVAAQAEQQPASAATQEQPQQTAEPRFQVPSGRKQSTDEAQLIRPEETVSLSVAEYNQLKSDRALLAALMAAGVDNWEGYDHAIEMAKAA